MRARARLRLFVRPAIHVVSYLSQKLSTVRCKQLEEGDMKSENEPLLLAKDVAYFRITQSTTFHILQ